VLFGKVEPLPLASAPEFLPALSDLIVRLGDPVVIPTVPAEIDKLAVTAERAKQFQLLMAPSGLVATFSDKLETAHWLSDHGFPTPQTVMLDAVGAADLPLVIKPRVGSGSRNVDVVRHLDHLSRLQAAGGDMVAQEYLAGDDSEYTCALFRARGETRCLVMRRTLLGGLTGTAVVENRPEIVAMLSHLAEESLLNGSINVQLRLTAKGPRIFEINPRFSSTVMMRHRLGFQDLVWAVRDLDGNPPPHVHIPDGGRVYRMSREVVILS